MDLFILDPATGARVPVHSTEHTSEARQKALREASGMRSVAVFNAGPRTICARYNAEALGERSPDGRIVPEVFEFPPVSPEMPEGSVLEVPMAAAWLWFGDPGARQDVRLWSHQVACLQARWGYPVVLVADEGSSNRREKLDPDGDCDWRYILDGHFFCPALGMKKGKGRDYYQGAESSTAVRARVARAAVQDEWENRTFNVRDTVARPVRPEELAAISRQAIATPATEADRGAATRFGDVEVAGRRSRR